MYVSSYLFNYQKMSISTLEIQTSAHNQLLANEPSKNDLLNDLWWLDYQILNKRKNELLKNIEDQKAKLI